MKYFISLLLIFSAVAGTRAQQSAHAQSNIHKFVVDEVLQTTSYTYLLANENGVQQWLALPKIQAAVGEVYYYANGIEMKEFKSTELNRVFPSVLFIQGVQSAKSIEAGNKQETTTVLPASAEEIVPVAGAITIAELYANKTRYNGKRVKITGKVTKYNAKIMGKNWIHLQDGTAHGSDNDLTVTTQMSASVGATITVEGIIVLDKDFGAGYFYGLIMEKAEILD